MAQAPNPNSPFVNYNADENAGKQLFLLPPPLGGAGCQACHRAPEFDIDPASRINGVIAVANNTTAVDLNNTRDPSLRNVFKPSGDLNGPLMHNGLFSSMVLNHYSQIPHPPVNTNLDQRLAKPGRNLKLNQQ